MKDIKGYEGLYAITSCGRVYSYKSKKFLKTSLLRGYARVDLHKNGVSHTYQVHRLVAEAYIPNPNNYTQVNHKDEIKSHNYINNLEWCDAKYNCNYGNRCKRISEAKSKPIYCSTNNTRYDSAQDASASLGLVNKSINRVASGLRKSLHGYHFVYINKNKNKEV